MRELRLVFGATTASVAAVLAIFMAGLGIGSATLGKRADRVTNPLRMYGLLEAAIALSVAISPWLIDVARLLYVRLGGQESLGLGGATAVRLLLSTVVMAVPTFLMGGTLPAAVRSVTSAADGHRRYLGILYGSNTLGAVFGAAASTFFALEHLGTRWTLWSGCLLGLCAGWIAVVRARKFETTDSTPQSQRDDGKPRATDVVTPSHEQHVNFRGSAQIIYFVAAILGFTFFALELVWYRMLAPILGGTAFTFGLILCVALFGIGLGGLAYNLLFRKRAPSWSALAITCGCEALFTVVPYVLGDRLALIAGWNAQAARSFGDLVLGWTYVTCIVVLPVALISGIQFPLLVALLGQGRPGISRQLGTTYAWNTFGAIAGSLVAGFGAMPSFGAPQMWLAIGLLLAATSLAILLLAPRMQRRQLIAIVSLLLLTAAAIFAQGPTAAWRHSSIGAGRGELPPKSAQNMVQKWLNDVRHLIVWDADGIESSIAITSLDGLGFVVNGKNDGNAIGDAATQVGLSILGAVLHENPKNALVIGLGTGESAGWLSQFRDIEHVDVVELEPAIDEMAARCRELNWDVLHNPRVRRIYNDGREFVFTTNNKYDVIISEPSNPYRAGIAALYTTEFYEAVKKCLKPGGVFVQWLQAYEVSNDTVGTIISTVGSQFGHVEVWQALPLDLQLVCSDTPLKYTAEELRKRIESPKLKDALAKSWSVFDLEGFLSHFVAGPGWARAVANIRFFPLNTDDRTIVEYGFAKTLGQSKMTSLEQIRRELRTRGYHRPLFTDGAINWESVETRRQILDSLYGGKMSPEFLSDQKDKQLVQAAFRCAAGDYVTATQLWPADRRQPTDRIERLLLAKCYAGSARPEFSDLVGKVAEDFPTEAAALRALYHLRKNESRKSVESLADLFSRLEKDPWLVPQIIDEVIAQSVVIAKAEPAAARKIYELVSKPFASERININRQILRIFVADQLGPDQAVAALAEYEPHPFWIEQVLEIRARAYAAVGHPRAVAAQRDLDRFRRNDKNVAN